MSEKIAASLGDANMVTDACLVAAHEGRTMRAQILRYNPRRDIVTPKPCSQERDLSSRAGSIQHAAELNEFWAKRGYPQAHFEAVQRGNIHRHGANEPMWSVTSNLHNGLPPKVVP